MRPGSIEYDPVLAEEILERLADGDSLMSICRDEGMPDERSVRRWARNHGDFGPKYAVARRLGYEKRADELLEIADDSSADWIDTDDGHRVLNGAHVNRARLMIDTRKWLLSKMLPKVYGEQGNLIPLHQLAEADHRVIAVAANSLLDRAFGKAKAALEDFAAGPWSRGRAENRLALDV